MKVLGEATIKDSIVTANGWSGVIAWKQGEGCKGICTVGENVQCSGNNTRNRPGRADCVVRAGGQLPGAPPERVLVTEM